MQLRKERGNDSMKSEPPKRYDSKFYRTTKWFTRRTAVLLDEPTCRHCKENGRITEARVVDHIIPRSWGGDDYDWDNLQPLCHRCHNIKTNREKKKSKIKR